MPGCQTCTSNSTCSSFFVSSLVYVDTDANGNQTYYPYICEPGCASCSPTYVGFCLACSSGFAMIYNQITFSTDCVACPPGCSSCDPTNPTICTSCVNTLVFDSNTSSCLPCAASSGCLTCTPTNLTNCTSCPFGYFLTTNNGLSTCAGNLCPENCLTCNYTYCTSCDTGFGLTAAGVCLPCMANCRICSGQTQSVCIVCELGFSLNAGGVCTNCSTGCSQCSPQGCIQCAPGYTLNAVIQMGTPICVPTCQPPCKTCQTGLPTFCTDCILGYSPTTTGVCTPVCQPSANADFGLLACGNGQQYIPTGSTTSFQCSITNCATCNQTACFACNPGFYLSGTTCQPCD